MKHIKTISDGNQKKPIHDCGCGECQASCQSACKTSVTVANQSCESDLNHENPQV
ncbi:MAG: six-cysteine ranthipeptide SCIFF [Oscillospiraceae bacterium]|jgi:predicted ribosomally synthesized six-cysteine peptide SCIFF|nr:six-cysteine ranthipeptide SCIFF [Oscillospiraceae bacterium]